VADLSYPHAVVDGFELGVYVGYGDGGDAWVGAADGSFCCLIWAPGSSPTSGLASRPGRAGGGEPWLSSCRRR
jgi:hypothetical protein